jgi:hypothetical protein
LPRPVRGMLAFLLVWVVGAALVGFGAGITEMIVLTLLALVAFVLASREPASQRADPST